MPFARLHLIVPESQEPYRRAEITAALAPTTCHWPYPSHGHLVTPADMTIINNINNINININININNVAQAPDTLNEEVLLASLSSEATTPSIVIASRNQASARWLASTLLPQIDWTRFDWSTATGGPGFSQKEYRFYGTFRPPAPDA